MGNRNYKSNIDKIIAYVRDLPYFSKKNLEILGIKDYYLKIALSRMEKSSKVIRLKKGMYALTEFINKTKMDGNFSYYLEFIGSKIYSPSYLSLEYVLYENNVLTDIPRNFTYVTINKPYIYKNKLGVFIYHKIKDELFTGYKIVRKGDFLIYKADKVKAMFDFLYLRKRIILDESMANELRLNIEVFNNKDRKKLKKYIELEGLKRMKEIYQYIFEL